MSQSDCSASDEKGLIVKFGVITDVQYADVADRPAWYDATKTRYYRSSLQLVGRAIDAWNGTADGRPLFALQDLIDGISSFRGLDSLQALRTTLDRFDSSIPVFHVIGNHELYNFKRPQLVSLLRDWMDKQEIVPKGYNDKAHLYYSFSPTPGVKFIALDCFEISILGYELDDQHENCTKAADLMLQKHGRVDHDLWDTNGELQGLEQRFQLQNGGISTKQLQWLDSELTLSDIQQERVIVFGHVCLLPQSCDPSCLLWNYDQVIACFARHPSVVAYLSGHAHESGNGTDSSGVHYVVFNGVIETPPDSDSFATLSLFHDRLLVDGYGKEHSTSLPLVDRFTNKSAELLTNSLVTMKGVRKVSDGPLVLVSV